MKKIVLFLSVIVLSVVLLGCGSNPNKDNSWRLGKGTYRGEEAIYLDNSSIGEEKTEIAGSLTLIETAVKNHYILAEAKLEVKENYKVNISGGGYDEVKIKNGGTKIESLNVNVTRGTDSEKKDLPYVSFYFHYYGDNKVNFDLREREITIDLTQDIEFEVKLKDDNNEDVTFKYTIEASKIK
ncbi:MAG: hypothetical protein RBQ97_04980 [Acholeplasma sp.]|nr:hypothetical protein [Acholeplasma sp.]